MYVILLMMAAAAFGLPRWAMPLLCGENCHCKGTPPMLLGHIAVHVRTYAKMQECAKHQELSVTTECGFTVLLRCRL
jgi:hypothetical protein